jgi:hypothetical protein
MTRPRPAMLWFDSPQPTSRKRRAINVTTGDDPAKLGSRQDNTDADGAIAKLYVEGK